MAGTWAASQRVPGASRPVVRSYSGPQPLVWHVLWLPRPLGGFREFQTRTARSPLLAHDSGPAQCVSVYLWV